MNYFVTIVNNDSGLNILMICMFDMMALEIILLMDEKSVMLTQKKNVIAKIC